MSAQTVKHGLHLLSFANAAATFKAQKCPSLAQFMHHCLLLTADLSLPNLAHCCLPLPTARPAPPTIAHSDYCCLLHIASLPLHSFVYHCLTLPSSARFCLSLLTISLPLPNSASHAHNWHAFAYHCRFCQQLSIVVQPCPAYSTSAEQRPLRPSLTPPQSNSSSNQCPWCLLLPTRVHGCLPLAKYCAPMPFAAKLCPQIAHCWPTIA